MTLRNTTAGTITDLNLRSLRADRVLAGQPLDVEQLDGPKPHEITGLPLDGDLGPGLTRNLVATLPCERRRRDRVLRAGYRGG